MYCKAKEKDALVDMTLCQPSVCEKKEQCWRYTHETKNVWWQSYSDFSLQEKPPSESTNRRHQKKSKCDFFIQNDPQDKDRRK